MKIHKARSSLVALGATLLVACVGPAPFSHPVIGEWDTEITTPMGLMTAVIIVNRDLSASMISPQLGEGSIDAVQVNGEAVSFSTEIDAMGQAVALGFAGAVAGDTLTGTLSTAFGPLTVYATRR